VKVRFLEIAEIELDEAVRWYAEQAPGLGDAFLIEVLVLTVAHLHRRPGYWRDRVQR